MSPWTTINCTDAIEKAMRSNLNAYDNRKAIDAMTDSRAAADTAVHLASHGILSADDFEPYLRTALVSRVWRIYDQVYGHGSPTTTGEERTRQVGGEDRSGGSAPQRSCVELPSVEGAHGGP